MKFVSETLVFGELDTNVLIFVVASDQNLRFTFMIVGSRGDVQPVIALALRLETYGHKCKIATHEAHRKFVEDNGLAFFPLAGDPKDLMALCVKNDMFSISFFKEALSKFTHFMADLLVTCWDACKTDTDVILENPPCMAGPSIAEKLGIPLIELFTIPWTRTTQFPNVSYLKDFRQNLTKAALCRQLCRIAYLQLQQLCSYGARHVPTYEKYFE
jgi:sterol 3beta-glucosyltransferase